MAKKLFIYLKSKLKLQRKLVLELVTELKSKRLIFRNRSAQIFIYKFSTAV